jgi:hypothetical protein
MLKIPWCSANSIAIPTHMAESCEQKHCEQLVYMNEIQLSEIYRRKNG